MFLCFSADDCLVFRQYDQGCGMLLWHLFIAFHLLYELYENTEGFFRKKEKIAALSCSLIVGALYRKNVIYAVFLYLVLCAVFCKKQKRKIISLFAGTILLTMLLSVGMELCSMRKKVPR